MFLAHVRHFNPTTPDNADHLTFTCQVHTINELLTLLMRYKRLVNELNDTPDDVYQLLSITDVGTTIPISYLHSLGAIELSRDNMAQMKSQRNELRNSKNRIEMKTILNPDLPSEDSFDDTIVRGFNLPELSEMLDPDKIPRLHPIVRDLFKSGYLWLSQTGDVVSYHLLPGKQGKMVYTEGEMKGPCFLVEKGSSYYLSANQPISSEGTPSV